MESLGPVYCRQCKLGFSTDTRLCPSCGIELVREQELDAVTDEVDGEIDVSDLNLLRTCDAGWGRNLLEKLTDNGISFRALPHRRSGIMSVYVADEFIDRAKRIDHEVFQAQVPGTESVRYAKDLPFGACPACRTPLGELDKECRSCGLVMSGSGWICTSCQGELQGEEKHCPHCGEKVDWDKV